MRTRTQTLGITQSSSPSDYVPQRFHFDDCKLQTPILDIFIHRKQIDGSRTAEQHSSNWAQRSRLNGKRSMVTGRSFHGRRPCSCIGTTLFRWMRTIAWPPYIYRPIYTAMEAADCLITETIHSRSTVPPRPEQKLTIHTWSHRNNSRNCRADGRNNTPTFTGFDSFYQKRNCVNNSIYLSSFPCY